MYTGYQNKTHRGSAAVMFSALSLLFVCMANVLPVLRITCFFICSMFIMGIMLEGMTVSAFLSFAAVLFLGFMIVPDKAGMFPYLFFFGHYGIFKSFVDGSGDRGRALALKLVYYNIGMALIHFFGGGFFTAQWAFLGIPWWGMLIAGEAVFLLYDWAFSKIAAAYYANMRNRLVGAGRH
ncbi:MAG: hypothetical protein ACOYJB_08620 [Christensenellaceae bacterium]